MADNEESEWRFGVDEVGEDGVVDSEAESIEPGSVSAENVAFFVLGVCVMAGAIGLLVLG